MLLVIGVVLSNLCLLGGLALLYRIAVDYLRRDAESARQAVILALLFPASFFFSCFYTEGLFLFLSLAAFYAALKWKWPLAGLFGALAALTRLQGGFILLPLLWLYMDGMQWRVREIRREVFWLALIPVAVGAHIYRIYTLTQDFFSIFKAQQAWSKPAWFSPAQILLQLNSDYGRVIRIDTALALLFLVAGVIMLWKFPSRAFGVYTLGMLAIPLCISRMVSLSRYIAVLFPVFILLGAINRPRWVYRLLCLLFFTVQILYWVGWQNYYFIN
jgi:hypothetical protein